MLSKNWKRQKRRVKYQQRRRVVREVGKNISVGVERSLEAFGELKEANRREKINMLLEDRHELFKRALTTRLRSSDNVIMVSNGWPDWVIEKDGKVVFVEVEDYRGKLKKNQILVKRILEKVGFKFYVYRGEEEIIDEIVGDLGGVEGLR